ncbi:MAG: transcriptional repressor [Bacteroidota bacterium]|jgi:Fur family ferric uptake transcriptional regulator
MLKKRETSGKRQVLQLLENSSSALSQDMLEKNPELKIDRVTIYRILKSFEEDGKIHRIVGNDGKAYFAVCRNCSETHAHHLHQHVHFQCKMCSKVECLNAEISLPIPPDYVVDDVNVVMSGICGKCKTAK